MENISEHWKDIIGYENYYQTNLKEIRSVKRFVFNKSLNKKMLVKSRILKPTKIVKNVEYFKLSKDGENKTYSINELIKMTNE